MAEPWTPACDDLAAIFAPVSRQERLILAVSGGSDSMALLHLASRWAQAMGTAAPQLLVATVDHGLRAGSEADARKVCLTANALGLPSQILTWRGAKPERGVQEKARAMRYELLGRLAADCGTGPCAIVTAHTRDDQAETVLMRLARGSGPDGLQGMRRVRAMAMHRDVVLIRPLLDHSRDQLRSFLIANGIGWIDDPSNEDMRFERVRLRAAAATLGAIGLTPNMLSLAAQRQRRAVAALEAATDALAAAALDLHGGVYASIEPATLRTAPDEIQTRLLIRVLTMFGGTSHPAELAKVERLVQALASGPPTRMTLGGCEVRACGRQIRVFREPGRAQLTPIELDAGQETIWDGRFRIRRVAAGPDFVSTGPVIVRPLDVEAAGALRRRVRPRLVLPSRAAATLPAVWAGGDLVSVGGLPSAVFEHRSGDLPKVDVRFLFQPISGSP